MIAENTAQNGEATFAMGLDFARKDSDERLLLSICQLGNGQVRTPVLKIARIPGDQVIPGRDAQPCEHGGPFAGYAMDGGDRGLKQSGHGDTRVSGDSCGSQDGARCRSHGHARR